MLSIKSQQILRKVGAGFFILLLLLFLTDYFRVRANYGEVIDNLEYNEEVGQTVTLEVKSANMHPELKRENYFQILGTLDNEKLYPYLQGKDIYLDFGDIKTSKVEELDQMIVTGNVIRNNFGMLKMEVTKIDEIN